MGNKQVMQTISEIQPKKLILKLYNMGLSPIPIRNKKKEGSFNKGELKFYMENGFPIEYVEIWLEKGCYQNIGILHGELHGNIYCFDYDNPENVKILGINPDELMKKGSWVQKTPGEEGRYHEWVIDNNLTDHGCTKKHSIEFRGNNHYTLFYPSIHPNGGKYDLLNLKDQSVDELSPPAEMDAMKYWNESIVKPLDEHFKNDESLEISDRKEAAEKKNDENLDKDFCPAYNNIKNHGVKKGHRHDAVYFLASVLQQKGEKKKDVSDNINRLYLDKFEKNGESNSEIDEEVKEVVEDVFKNKDKYAGCNKGRETGACPYDRKKDCEYYKKYYLKFGILSKYNVIYHKKKADDKEGKASGKLTCSHSRMAKLIQKEHGPFIQVLNKESNPIDLYRYHNGIWVDDGEVIVRELIEYYLGDTEFISSTFKNEVIGHIRDKSHKKINKFEPDPRYINCNNGVYDLKEEILLPHGPKFHFLQKIPVNYEQDAKCPKILKTFSEILGHDDKKLTKLQEMFGLSPYRINRYHYGWVFFGRGRNGKSTITFLHQNMLGPAESDNENVSNVKLHTLATNRFGPVDLHKKLANVSSEMSQNHKPLNDTSTLKEIESGNYMRVEQKGKPAYNIKPYCTLIFECNTLPETNDKTSGFYEKQIFITFTEIFNDDNIKPIDDLKEKLASDKEEMSGLLNWSIEGLKRVVKNGKISHPEHTMNIDGKEVELWDFYSHPEREFFHTFLDVADDPNYSLDVNQLYINYTKWMDKICKVKERRNTFYDALNEYYTDTYYAKFKDGKIPKSINMRNKSIKGFTFNQKKYDGIIESTQVELNINQKGVNKQ